MRNLFAAIRKWLVALPHGVKHHAPHILIHLALIAALIVALVGAPLSLLALSQQPKAPHAPVRIINSHVCDRRDYVTGCALPNATLGQIVRGVDPVQQGVDFGWSCPVSLAKNFGASYLSYDPSKDWSLSCINAFHAAHKGTVAVWEAGASDATRGYSVGYQQAKQAAAELAALHAPASQPFDMAIDCDCAGSTLAGYFKGANAAEPGRINAYGGYDQINYLHSQHLVGHLNWQTYAWSGGRWLPASIAPLEQFLNSNAVDYDRAIATSYGQWPAPTTVPLCQRTECYTRYPTITVYNTNGQVCQHGCAIRYTVKQYDYYRSRRVAQPAKFRAFAGRNVFLTDRFAYLEGHRSPAVNLKYRTQQLRNQTWHRGARHQSCGTWAACVK